MQPFEYTAKHVPGAGPRAQGPKTLWPGRLSLQAALAWQEPAGDCQLAPVQCCCQTVLMRRMASSLASSSRIGQLHMELIRSYHNCEVGHHGVNRTVASIQAAVAAASGHVAELPRNLRKHWHVQWLGRLGDVLCVRSSESRERKLAARLPMNLRRYR